MIKGRRELGQKLVTVQIPWYFATMIKLRPATISDLKSITDIYNHAIVHSTATFDTEIKSLEDRQQWFRAHGERHPIWVAQKDEAFVGWGSLSRWSDRCAYDDSAEDSIYVAEGFRGQGVGKLLLKKLIEEARRAQLHTILARISDGNQVSIGLHELFGFKMVGVMKEVGFKFNRRLDVTLMQLLL